MTAPLEPPTLSAPPPPDADKGAKKAFVIPSLDGIRGMSFLIVFVAHAGLKGIVPAHFGLTLFFFLSGYLITTLMRMEWERTGTVSIRQFYLRRVLRILPPFYLVLFVAMALTAAGWLGGFLTRTGIVWQASHLTNYYIIRYGWWDGMPPGTSVYWSLAVEEHFYLVFPLLFLLLRRRVSTHRTMAMVLLGICAAILVWRLVLVFGLDASKERAYVATDTRIDSILLGCVLALWHNPVLDPKRITDRQLAWVWLPLGIASILVSLVVGHFWFEHTFRYTLQSAGLFPFFIAAVRWHDRLPFRAFSWWPLPQLGLLSYTLYLMHHTALFALHHNTTWPAPLRVAVAFVVILALAWIIYVWIERPCARARRRLSKYLEGTSARGAT